jgi:hypothetical protein
MVRQGDDAKTTHGNVPEYETFDLIRLGGPVDVLHERCPDEGHDVDLRDWRFGLTGLNPFDDLELEEGEILSQRLRLTK